MATDGDGLLIRLFGRRGRFADRIGYIELFTDLASIEGILGKGNSTVHSTVFVAYFSQRKFLTKTSLFEDTDIRIFKLWLLIRYRKKFNYSWVNLLIINRTRGIYSLFSTISLRQLLSSTSNYYYYRAGNVYIYIYIKRLGG